MQIGREFRRRLRSAVPPALFLALVAYFVWNAIQGDHGLIAYADGKQQLKAARDDLARAEAERVGWERKVGGLRDRLDPDMLDERARTMLNLADPADLVVLYPPDKKLF